MGSKKPGNEILKTEGTFSVNPTWSLLFFICHVSRLCYLLCLILPSSNLQQIYFLKDLKEKQCDLR